MSQETNKYYAQALDYLETYFHIFTEDSFYSGFQFMKALVEEGEKIAAAESLTGFDYENALLIICFRFAGVTSMLEDNEVKYKLFMDFSAQVAYPATEVETVINSIKNNSNHSLPANMVEKVAWDAIDYHLVIDNLVVMVSFMMTELNENKQRQCTELEILTALKSAFLKSTFFTNYAIKHYTDRKQKNFSRLLKRIQKVQQAESKSLQESNQHTSALSAKETEDLFKIAFRNYVHLVSVADAKARLLIGVNSAIISIVIAFVVTRSTKYPMLTLPAILLLTVSFITIVISILASRPQSNRLIQDKDSESYQTFFFGSFDLIDNGFSKAGWEDYYVQLTELFNNGKEKVYMEIFKESFNVRKVLAKKFSYLSKAYWIFLGGLLISIIAFLLRIHTIEI